MNKVACQIDKSITPVPLLLYQKTPCYGSCPAYEATVMQNGSITFIGWENVPIVNTVQLCLPKPDLDKLKEELAQLDYPSLKSSYLTEWTDRPTTYITFYQNGKETKRIKHQDGGPDNLAAFLESIHLKVMRLVNQHVQKSGN
ncbi:DUF6438 domain-containing protein [uncultured Pontibacter sp.]|uniref:DUF6438 domain-containing protein n=1 Tax=uncultured Pontibacter sp. TaxID=453356 RepID=UPI002611FC43|nr:DUF6438 domain-containing protein [uncultured Pontibacter sp.]